MPIVYPSCKNFPGDFPFKDDPERLRSGCVDGISIGQTF